MAKPLYAASDHERITDVAKSGSEEPFRSAWRRDYARLIHSASFRRLQGKTQVFPGHEGDFFRNRLTHSLEVAQVAKSIAVRLNATHPVFSADDQKIEPDLVELAGLAHDLGHPPFGHNGEEALDACMKDHGGFEGNAQTLRILSTLEKKSTVGDDTFRLFTPEGIDERRGLNLSFRSLASVLKYDNVIPERSADRPDGKQNKIVKGYYKNDFDLVCQIKKAVVGANYSGSFKTVECTIMDIADDIAYSTYDLEDVIKSGFLGQLGFFGLDSRVYDAVVSTVNYRLSQQYSDQPTTIDAVELQEILHFIFVELFEFGEGQLALLRNRKVSPAAKKMYYAVEAQQRSQLMASNGYYRTRLTSGLVQKFLEGIEVVENKDYSQLHTVRLERDTFVVVEVLKNLTYEAVIRSPALQVVEFRGKDIIGKIFNAIIKDGGDRLLPADYREIYHVGDEVNRHRTVCDFIAGMTDRYAIEFYSRLFGANGMTLHKPL